VTRRYYHLGETEGGRLRILDQGTAPRLWQLIHGSLNDRFLLGLVIGQVDDRPIVEPMTGSDDGYPVAGRRVWYRGPAPERRRLGLPAPGRWWRELEMYGEAARANGRLLEVMIDGTLCRVIAVSAGHRFLVTAPLNPADIQQWTAQRASDNARLITVNTELASRYSDHRGLPIPAGADSLQLFGDLLPWTMMMAAEDTPTSVVSGRQSQFRAYEPTNVYWTKVALTVHIWRAGPRGGRLIGFEYGRSGTLAGIVPWTGKRDQALRLIASEYEKAYWREYTNGIGGD
jgi:hypothetical protein